MERAGRREAWGGGARERSITERADLSSFPGCWSEIIQMCVWCQLCPLKLRKFLFSPVKNHLSPELEVSSSFSESRRVPLLPGETPPRRAEPSASSATSQTWPTGLLLAASADEVEEQLLLISPGLQGVISDGPSSTPASVPAQ